MYFLRDQFFGVYGCWLVWLLLYVFMVADWLMWLLICLTIIFSKTEPEKKCIFIKVFTTSKTFVILIIHILNPFKRFIKIIYFVWQMTNEKWEMRNHKWEMANDKCQMRNDKWQPTSQKPPGGSPKQVPSLGAFIRNQNQILVLPLRPWITSKKRKL